MEPPRDAAPLDAFELLLEAGALLAHATDFRATLAKIAELVVPELGDWSVLDLVLEDGTLERVVVHHREPEKVRFADELLRFSRESPSALKNALEVAASGVSALTVQVERHELEAAWGDPRHRDLLRQLGVDSLVRVPLVSHGNVLGVLTLVYEGSGRRHGVATLRVAEELANRCALALENALLYERQRAARERSEHLAERLQLATEGSGIGIWDYDPSTRLLNGDARMRELFGLSADEEITFERFLQRVPEEDRAGIERVTRETLAAGPGARLEHDHRALGAGDKVRWVTGRARVAPGDPPGFVGTVLDITHRKQSEAAAALAGDVGLAISEALSLEQALSSACAAIVDRLGVSGAAIWITDSEEGLALVGSASGSGSAWSPPQRGVFEHAPFAELGEQRRLLNRRLVLNGAPLEAASAFLLGSSERRAGVLLVNAATALPVASTEALSTLALQLSVSIERFWFKEGSEHQFRLLAETIPNLVWTAERNGVHDYFNRRWYEYTGYSEETPVEIQWAESLHPDVREEAVREWERCYRSGEPFQMEYLRRGRTGGYHWFLARAVAVRDSRGRIVKWFGTCTDIDEQKRADEERGYALEQARASEEQFRAVVENVPELAWSALPDGYIDFYNRRWYEYTGRSFDDDAGWGWKDVHDPDVVDQVVARWTHSLETGEPFEMEFPLKGADGQFRWFLTRVAPLRASDGRIIRWFGTNTNIDGQKRLQRERDRLIEQLERKNRELDQFAYIVSHDLKAPLRGISMLSHWIQEEHEESNYDKLTEHVELMKKRVARMEALINGVLDFSRAGRESHELHDVDLRGLISDVCEMVPSGKTIEIDVPEGIQLSVQRLPLGQVLLNLISNALKFADPDEPKIRVSARRDGNELEFEVVDNGPGIDPRHHERIWVLFQTLSGGSEHQTGIGLAIVQKLVEAAGGRAWVESAPGEGARFRFTWPVAD